MPSEYDVIVIGAGFTGLSAATSLVRHGMNVLVLEARDRVGGRTEATRLQDGSVIDGGGQFFSRDMPRVSALVEKYGRRVVETWMDGDSLFLPPIDAREADAIYSAVNVLREEMLMIEPDDPASAALSVGQWLDAQTRDKDVRAAFRAMVEGLWNQPAEILPLWYLISNDRRVTSEYSELEYFLADTMQALAEDLAGELGDRIRLSTPVRRIVEVSDGIDIETEHGRFSADRVVIALPPVMAGRLDYQPPLPVALRSALNVWKPGAVLKVFLRYERAFWREKGLSGTIMWRQPTGLYACDVSGPEVAGLVLFLSGTIAADRAGRSHDALVSEAKTRLVEALGEEAANPVEVSIRNWVDDPWSSGAYGDAISDFSAVTAEDVLRQGAGRLQFACSELASSFPCYIEGAIVAGEEVAARILGLGETSREE